MARLHLRPDRCETLTSKTRVHLRHINLPDGAAQPDLQQPRMQEALSNMLPSYLTPLLLKLTRSMCHT
jgi:hypothetical protein